MKKLGRTILFLFISVVLLSFSEAELTPAAAKSASKSPAKINKSEVSVDINEEFTLKFKTTLTDAWVGINVEKQKSDGTFEYSYGTYSYTEKKNGKYVFSFKEGGTFRLTMSVLDYDTWQTYADSCLVKVRNIGPAKRKMALLIGSSEKITIDNGEFVSAEVVKNTTNRYWSNYVANDALESVTSYADTSSVKAYGSYYVDPIRDDPANWPTWDAWYDWHSEQYGETWENEYDCPYYWDNWETWYAYHMATEHADDYLYDDDDYDYYDYDDYDDYDYDDYDDNDYDDNSDGDASDNGQTDSDTDSASGNTVTDDLPDESDNDDDGDDWDDYWYDWIDAPEEAGEVELKNNKITGTKAGRVTICVTWKKESGETVTENIIVDVTDPVYKPHEGYLLANNSLWPDLSGTSDYSEITLSVDNEKICTVQSDYFYFTGAGTCVLTIIVDGRTFTDSITVYDPKLSDDILLVKKKKTAAINVTGLPDGIETTYTSANKKIATVSEDGTIKAKKKGSTYISIRCGDLCSFTCSVTVGDGKKGMKAALQAKKYIGSAYSQDKRMQDGYFDCSSLAWRSYKASGTAIGGQDSYAPTAANLGKYYDEAGKAIAREYISPDELQPGDLIFYSSSNNGRYLNIDHVAVYFGAYYGDGGYYWYDSDSANSGMIVHARSGGVQFSNYSWYMPGGIVLICRP